MRYAGVRCPRCGNINIVKTRVGYTKCRRCGRRIRVAEYTVFHANSLDEARAWIYRLNKGVKP